jgi:hypothetical protein
LRTLDTAATTYHDTYQDGYPGSLGVLGPPAGGANPSCNAAGLVDNVLATANVAPGKSGYMFTWVVGSSQVAPAASGCAAGGYTDMFSVTASPFGFPTGTIYYCVDGTGVIREDIATITATSAGCPMSALPIANN